MFRFRLQNVLDLRERQERELASQLVNALSDQESAEQMQGEHRQQA
jgi:flagellar biosynthesis chaperone FliJ